MALRKEQIEHLEHYWKDNERPWKNFSRSRKYMKKQVNKYIRLQGKKNIDENTTGGKKGRKPLYGWEY